jgi:hypothetical protein
MDLAREHDMMESLALFLGKVTVTAGVTVVTAIEAHFLGKVTVRASATHTGKTDCSTPIDRYRSNGSNSNARNVK